MRNPLTQPQKIFKVLLSFAQKYISDKNIEKSLNYFVEILWKVWETKHPWIEIYSRESYCRRNEECYANEQIIIISNFISKRVFALIVCFGSERFYR